MLLQYALLFYLFLIIILIFVFVALKIKLWSAIVLALIIGQVALLCLAPPSSLDSDKDSDACMALYALIIFATLIVVYVYAIIAAWRDARIKPTENITHYAVV